MEALARGCGITAVAACGVACALILWVLWGVHRSWNNPPPDVGAFAHSADTRAADAAAARTSSVRLTNLTSALPWAQPLGTSVADSCRTENQNSFMGPALWAPITCARSSVLYLAFDGDIRARLHQLDAVLAEQGWVASDYAAANTLTAMATRLSLAGGDPSPAMSQQGSTKPPGTRPTCLSMNYRPASQERELGHGGLGVRLRASVTERPCPPLADTGDIQIHGRPEQDAADGTVYLAWHPLSADAVSRSAHATHRYVAAFSLIDSYAAQSTATATPLQPSTPYGVPPCLSGSHCG